MSTVGRQVGFHLGRYKETAGYDPGHTVQFGLCTSETTVLLAWVYRGKRSRESSLYGVFK